MWCAAVACLVGALALVALLVASPSAAHELAQVGLPAPGQTPTATPTYGPWPDAAAPTARAPPASPTPPGGSAPPPRSGAPVIPTFRPSPRGTLPATPAVAPSPSPQPSSTVVPQALPT